MNYSVLTRLRKAALTESCAPNVIEGEDFLVLNEECVAIGISQRSTAGTIQRVGGKLASELFLNGLAWVTDPEKKRKIIGELLIT